MSNTSRLTIAAVLVALLSGCASQNPYDNQSQQSSGGMSKTAKYGGLGALAGAVAGAFKDKPSSTYRHYVQRCLSDKGFDVIGWN